MEALNPAEPQDDAATLLDALLGVHTATSTAWLADSAATAAERGLGALYGLLFLGDAAGHLIGERPASKPRQRALTKLRDAFQADLGRLKFTVAEGSPIGPALAGGAAAAVPSLAEAVPLPIEAEQANAAQRALGVEKIWLAPLHWDGESMGLLLLLMPARPAASLAQAELFGRHVAVALRNLREKEAGRKRGELDAVRWVYDEWRFLEELTQEARRAQRHGRPLSLLQLRLRNLPELHERYGRFLAERLLRQLAARLAGAMRETDFLGASGDDGFAAILVEADREGARRAEERLLTGLDTLQIPNAELPGLQIELAYSTATLPEDGATAEELMAVAEERLGESTTELKVASAG